MPNKTTDNPEAVAAIFNFAARLTADPLVFVYADEDPNQIDNTGDHE